MKTSRIPREQNPHFLTGRRRTSFFSWFLPRRNSVRSSGGLTKASRCNERQQVTAALSLVASHSAPLTFVGVH